MRFEFATATRIVVGPGTLRDVVPAARELGRRALVACGKNAGRAAPLLASLEAAGLQHISFPVPGEPTTDLVRAGADQARVNECDLVIAIGGGSTLDAGK